MEMELSIDSPITPVDDHSEGTESLLRRRKVRSVVVLRTQHLMAVLMKLKKKQLTYVQYICAYVCREHSRMYTYVRRYVCSIICSYLHSYIHTCVYTYVRMSVVLTHKYATECIQVLFITSIRAYISYHKPLFDVC